MRDGRTTLVAGFTGSGKSAWVISQVQRCNELLVWDSDHEWSDRRLVEPVYTIEALKNRIVDHLRRGGRFRVGYAGPIKLRVRRGKKVEVVSLFPAFCRLAWIWGKAAPGRTVVVEELADVTSPGKAPDEWGQMLRKARKHGLDLYGLTQRPAESDKTIVSNAALIHSGFMGFPNDRSYMAECLGVSLEEVEKLKPLDYIERDLRTQELRRGRVRFNHAQCA